MAMNKRMILLMVVSTLGVGTILSSCNKVEPEDEKEVEVEWVDLGLPSGVLWANINIGATVPEDYGQVFGWGETETKVEYSWANYAHGKDFYGLTKYCSDTNYGLDGFTDNDVNLREEDDAAVANWKNGSRIPTKEDCQELKKNCDDQWTTRNGVTGRLFTAKNGNSIFLPAGGYRWGPELDCTRRNGAYWTRSLNANEPGSAWYFGFTEEKSYIYYAHRSYGRYVRPVKYTK